MVVTALPWHVASLSQGISKNTCPQASRSSQPGGKPRPNLSSVINIGPGTLKSGAQRSKVGDLAISPKNGMEDRPSSERVNFSICRASGDPASRIDGADIAGATARECAEISEGTTFPEKSVGEEAARDGTAIWVRPLRSGIGVSAFPASIPPIVKDQFPRPETWVREITGGAAQGTDVDEFVSRVLRGQLKRQRQCGG